VADPRETLIRNEQAKLTATYLNGIAIALAAVGGIAPWIAAARRQQSALCAPC
jgi:cation transport ATPase